MGLPPNISLGDDVVPGQTPGTTPTFVPSPGGDPSQQVNDKTKQILQLIAQASQRKQVANTAVPGKIPDSGQNNPRLQMGMNTDNPRAFKGPRFEAAVGTAIKTAIAKQKEGQLYKAEGDWTYLQSSLNELYQAQASGDPKAIAAAQAKVDSTMQDPKKLKNMAKALNQDWLNPEKTTVYGEALKNVTARGQQQDAAKDQARQGIMGIFKKIMGQKQQPQLTPEQQQRMAQEIQAKAPIQEATDKGAIELLKEQMKEEARAKEDAAKQEARDKEQEKKFEQQRELEDTKEKYKTLQNNVQNQFHERMQSLHEIGAEQRQQERDWTMIKTTGMRVDAQMEKMFKPEPTKVNKEITDTVTTLRQQRAQAAQQLKSLNTSANNKWFGQTRMKDQISDAEAQLSSLDKAISHIEKNRDAIVKGKADLGDVVGKAYDIMGGGGGDEVPGFVPDKKP